MRKIGKIEAAKRKMYSAQNKANDLKSRIEYLRDQVRVLEEQGKQKDRKIAELTQALKENTK